MEHQALYRKYRPKTFDDVCGQEHITSVLKYESEKGRLSHAYLFCGPRGTGKTSCAKILSKAVNCDSPINGNPCGKCYKCTSIDDASATDVVEMDAASNTGVEYIRDIRDEVMYTPAVMKKRVYIIDEVHMLSIGAFNALLKTLEEPPEHVVFILATTEQHKLPATIVSRCQRFDFRRITVDDISKHLLHISEKESISLTKEAAGLLAKQAQGGMRDAINLFELCAGGGSEVNGDRVRNVLGITGMENAAKTANAVKDGDIETLFEALATVVSSSKDIAVFWQELISFWRDMLVAKSVKNPVPYLDLTEGETELLLKTASRFTKAELIYHASLLDEALITMTKLPQIKRNTAEITLVKMSTPSLEATTDALLARVASLEDKMKLIGSVPQRTLSTEKQAPVEVKKEATVEIKTAEVNKAPAQPAAEKIQSWRAISDKGELLDKIASLNPILRGFIAKAACFALKDKTKVLIRVENSFTASMLRDSDSMMTLSDALVLAGIANSGAEIIIEVGEIPKDEESLLDELEEI